MHDEYLMKLASTRCIRRMVSKQSTYLFGLWSKLTKDCQAYQAAEDGKL